MEPERVVGLTMRTASLTFTMSPWRAQGGKVERWADHLPLRAGLWRAPGLGAGRTRTGGTREGRGEGASGGGRYQGTG